MYCYEGFVIESFINVSDESMFIMLLGYVLYSSQMREKEMREQLDKTVPVLEKILIRLDVIEDKLER